MGTPITSPLPYFRLRLAPLVLGLLLAPGQYPSKAADFDMTLQGGERPVGTLSAAAELGALRLVARHSEYLGYLNTGDREAPADNDPLLRSTSLSGRGGLDLGTAGDLALGLALDLEEWGDGAQEATLSAETGFGFAGLRLDNVLVISTALTAAGAQEPQGDGELVLSFDLFGGAHEAGLGYDALPLSRVTGFSLRSGWDLGAAGTARIRLNHEPLQGLSEARFGFSQALGPFDLASDFVADSRGAYSIGLQFTLDLGSATEVPGWGLAALMATLRAQGQPPAAPRVESLFDEAQ